MTSHPIILTVDTNERNQDLLGQFLEQEGYAARRATTIDEVDSHLREPVEIDVALVDVSGFDGRIWERCRLLQESGIPHLVISPREHPVVEEEGLAHGARAVLLKPLVVQRLMSILKGLTDEP